MLFFRLLLLFTVIPLIELALLIQISQWTNPLLTIGLVLLTGAIGAALARSQGLRTWQKMQQEISGGRPPAMSLVEGVMILIAGALLVTPGVLTDIVGFSLLVPGMRRLLAKAMMARLAQRATVRFQTFTTQARARRPHSPASQATVIDAEYEQLPDRSN